MPKERHEGSCQCGAVRFSAVVDLDQTITCNCSRCQRLGSVLSAADADEFTLETGADTLTEYRFNTNRIAHQFCSVCGIEPFAFGQSPEGARVAMINVNCLHGVDPRALTSHHYDGASV